MDFVFFCICLVFLIFLGLGFFVFFWFLGSVFFGFGVILTYFWGNYFFWLVGFLLFSFWLVCFFLGFVGWWLAFCSVF